MSNVNYDPLIDSNYTADGIPRVYASCRPLNTYTVFHGGGDNGNLLLFNLSSSDVNKEVDLTYTSGVWIKDGYIISKNAPFGAKLNVDIVHPVNGVIRSYCKDVPIFGDGWFPLDTEDRAFIPSGLILRVTITNSSGTNGEDPATAFKVAGRLEMFRHD